MKAITYSPIARLFKCCALLRQKQQHLCLLLITGLLSSPVFAGSDTTFSTMVDWVLDKLTGSLGALISIIALVIAIISAMVGQFKAFLIVLVVVVAATLGGSIVIGFFTATW